MEVLGVTTLLEPGVGALMAGAAALAPPIFNDTVAGFSAAAPPILKLIVGALTGAGAEGSTWAREKGTVETGAAARTGGTYAVCSGSAA